MEGLNINALNTIHLPVTIGTELLIEIVDLKARMKSELVGMDDGNYILIKLPIKDIAGGIKISKVIGSTIIIRYLFKGSVYGIKTKVLNIISDPADLVFVSFPQKIEEFNVRHNPRYECILPAVAQVCGEDIEMVIVDISNDGFRAVIKTSGVKDRDKVAEALDIDKTLQVMIQLPGIENKLGLTGKVRNINRDSDRMIFGAIFESIGENVKERLMQFISLISEIEKKK